ncbi:uncharacterized protein VTP21DRAFT_6912 [Calcarisporiella thermophila]|uniref:uncharacterized protein n=1 Tax=Calcarisporiella thermophila TaxID=911321 RepID=UPI003742DE83
MIEDDEKIDADDGHSDSANTAPNVTGMVQQGPLMRPDLVGTGSLRHPSCMRDDEPDQRAPQALRQVQNLPPLNEAQQLEPTADRRHWLSPVFLRPRGG